MPAHPNLIGQRFGKLLVLDRAERVGKGRRRWLCVCDCGQKRTALTYDLTSGRTHDCGRKKPKPVQATTATINDVAPSLQSSGFESQLQRERQKAHRRLRKAGGYYGENLWFMRSIDPERYRPPAMPAEYAAGVRAIPFVRAS